MKKYLYILFAIQLLSTSCENYFDVSPKSEIKADDFFDNEEGYVDALTGVYSLMSTRSLQGDNLSYGYVDVLAQYYGGIISNPNHNFLPALEYQYEDPAVRTRIESIWTNSYRAIANINGMLLFIDENQDVFSEGAYEVLKGEAIGLRAYLHFNLLRLFGEAPVLGGTTEAIPYMDEYTNIAKQALPVNEVISRIVLDLEQARSLMAENDPYGPNYDQIVTAGIPAPLQNREFHLNYYAVTAALAEVHYYAGNADQALAFAQEIIGSADGSTQPVTLFNFANIIDDPAAEVETIFGLNVSKLETYSELYFGEDAFLPTTESDNALSIDNAVIDEMYLSNGASSVDNRPTAFFRGTGGSDRTLIKYADGTFIPQLKISELYLIAAESAADLETAQYYFNTFTANRGIEAITVATKEELDVEIYKEWRKEFIGEGKLFWFYKMHNATQIGANDSYTVEDPSIYTFPIPDAELEFGNI